MFNSIMNFFGNQTQAQQTNISDTQQNQLLDDDNNNIILNNDKQLNQQPENSSKHDKQSNSEDKKDCTMTEKQDNNFMNISNQNSINTPNKTTVKHSNIQSNVGINVEINLHETTRPSWSDNGSNYAMSGTAEDTQGQTNNLDNIILCQSGKDQYSNTKIVNTNNAKANQSTKVNKYAYLLTDQTTNDEENIVSSCQQAKTDYNSTEQQMHGLDINVKQQKYNHAQNQISIQSICPHMINNQLNQQKMKKKSNSKTECSRQQNTINSMVNQLVKSGGKEAQKIQSHLNNIQSSLSSLKNTQSFDFEVVNQDEFPQNKQFKKIKEDQDSINNTHNFQNSIDDQQDDAELENFEQNSDPVTGVLKRRINKSNKRTKEVSLTLNHKNLQQLMQMLQQHTADQNEGQACIKQDIKSSESDIDSNQQALNLIMQLITNNVNSPNELPNKGQSNDYPKIDPQLLEQLFCIDQEEEECTDSDEDGDDDAEADSSNDDGEDLDDMEADDDEPNDDEDNIDDDEDEDDEYGDDDEQYDNEDNEYGDEDQLYDDEDDVIEDQSFNQQIIPTKCKHHISSDEQLVDENHLDSLSLEDGQQSETLKQQQLKKGISHSQKQFAEDRKQSNYNRGAEHQDNVTLECGEQFFDQHADGQAQTNNGAHTGQCQTQQNQETTTIDGDNSSQYEDVGDINDAQTSSFDQEETDYSTSTSQNDNISKLLKQKLKVSDKLSPQFHRFYENFSQNVNFIIQYEYNILPQQKSYQNYQAQRSPQQQDLKARDTAQLILKKKYNNLRKLCEHNCKCFTGPHSVLQIFIEKIVQAIESFACKLKGLTRDELQLWVENDFYDNQGEDQNLNELNYSINGIDLNLIFKMQSMTKTCAHGVRQGIKDGMKEEIKQIQSDADNQIKQDSQVQSTLKYIEQNTKSEEAKQKLRQLGQMSDNQIKNLVQMASDYLKQKQSSQKFKPLLKNLPNYTQFLQNIICHYNLIIKQYAPNISRHFTEMTQVIKEGNKYEFPSQDIHRTILNKLIINDQALFRHFFQHIKQEYGKHEKAIKKKIAAAQAVHNIGEGNGGAGQGLSKTMQNYIKFIEVFECFSKDVEQDINKGVSLLNIDFYMRDLRKHALKEYNEVQEIEQAFLSMNDSMAKQLAEADKDLNTAKSVSLQTQLASSIDQLDHNELKQYNELLNQRYGFILSNQNDIDSANAIENDDMQQQIFDFNMLDSKEKKKLKKKQRKRDKKIKQQMAQHGLLPESEADKPQTTDPSISPTRQNEAASGDQQAMAAEDNDVQPPKQGSSNDQSQKKLQQLQALAPKGMYYCPQCKQFHTGINPNAETPANDVNDSQDNQTEQQAPELPQHHHHSQSTQKRRKGKNGGKLSHEQMKNLTTDELVSYIENEGKKKEKLRDECQEASSLAFSAESNKIQQMRAKAKAFVEKQKTTPNLPNQVNASNSKQKVDPNHFTCKFCNGSIDAQTLRFVHENFCLVGNSQTPTQKQQQPSNPKKKSCDNNQQKGRNNAEQLNSGTQMGEESTQGSNSQRNIPSGANDDIEDQQHDFDEDQKIEEFARKLELIQKMPNRYQGSGGQRRRRKLKPNISKDWVNKLRKQLKSQQNPQNRNIDGVSNSSESVGSYASSSNSNSNGKKLKIPNQYNSEASFAKKKGRLSDLSADQIKIQMQDHPEAQQRKDTAAGNQSQALPSFDKGSFNPKKLNLSMSAAQNRKKLQAAANSKASK